MDIEYIRQQLDIAALAIANAQDALPPPAPGNIYIVYPSDDIQSVIDSAKAGDIVEFIVGQKYITGSLTIPNKQLTLRSQGVLPDRQIHPDDNLATLSSGGPYSTIDGSFANNLTISGLYFEARADGAGDVIVLENAKNVTIDRVVVMGGPNGQKRGIRGNGENIIVKRCYIANIWRDGQDSQAFCAWNGAGPFLLEDSYFEAASENVMFGGADSFDAAHIPSNIVIKNCTFTKRDEWRTIKGHNIKNLFELKCARYVLIEDCLFEKNWVDGQSGFGWLIKSANQDGNAPWSVTEHVTFINCILRDTDNGINISGHDLNSGTTSDINFENCHIITKGIAIQVGGEAGPISFKFCTFENGYNFMSLYGTNYATSNLFIHNTRGNHNQYGVHGSGTGIGTPALDKYAAPYDWKDILLLDLPYPYKYPPTTYFKEADIPAGIIIGSSI